MSGEHDFGALARETAARHGFAEDATITAYRLSENPTFHVTDDTRAPAVLRIYRPGGRREVEIRSELAYMTAAHADAGVPIPPVLPALDGSVLLDLGAPGSPVYAAAFAVAPGRELIDDDLPTMIGRLGELTGRLHQHARGWTPPPWFSRPRWDLRTTLGEAPHFGPWQNGVPDVEERRQIERLARAVSRRLARFGEAPVRFGFVHGDLRMANVMFDGETLSIIDFDDAGLSWYLYDLGATLTAFDGVRPDVEALVASWVDAYRMAAVLPAADEREIPTFLMLRRLQVISYMGWRPNAQVVAGLRAAGFTADTCSLAESYLADLGQ